MVLVNKTLLIQTTKDVQCQICVIKIYNFNLFYSYFPYLSSSCWHSSPAAEVFCHCGPAAEEVGPERLELLSQFENGRQRLAVLIQTRVQLLDV